MLRSHNIQRLPLYRQVMDAMRERIREKQPGDRLGTEAEFVKGYGVSLVTIRRALRELESEGLLERRQGSGTFVPDTSIARRHVGILFDVDPTHPLVSPYFPKLVQQIRTALKNIGISSRAYYGFAAPDASKDDALSCQDVLDDIRLNRLKGLIAFAVERHESWTGILRAKNIPLLDMKYCWDHGWYSKSVFIKKALTHFQQRGRRRLAVLAWENPMLLFKPFQEEIHALAPQYGIELSWRLLDVTANAWDPGMGWERFREVWYESGTHKPDSLIILDDMLFADCQRAIEELRVRVPEQLDVLVRSSDAMNLDNRFPIHVYRTSVNLTAEKFSSAMQAMLHRRQPSMLDTPYDITFEEPRTGFSQPTHNQPILL